MWPLGNPRSGLIAGKISELNDWFSSKPCEPEAHLGCPDPIFIPVQSDRCPIACEVKGVQRQFRNKTKAVLKPLFKVGKG